MSHKDWKDFFENWSWPDSLNFAIGVVEPDEACDWWMLYIAQPRKNIIMDVIIDKAEREDIQKYLDKSQKVFLTETKLKSQSSEEVGE